MNRVPQIGIVGTFDVENYGDLLFPLIADAELTKRLGRIELHRYSYHAKDASDWPYDVTSVADLPSEISQLDGLLIGGGFIIRFDKTVAPGYTPPPGIHHPTGYWLTPALLAQQHDVPVAWNAPGMHCNDIPAWAVPLMEAAFASSAYISVRDELSRVSLSRFTDDSIAVVPDTGFGVVSVLDDMPPGAPEPDRRCEEALAGPYIVVQASLSSEGFVRFAKRNADRFKEHRFLALPIGPVLGDRNDIVAGLRDAVTLSRWPHPLVLADLVRNADAVVGHSYHLAITAYVSGVPVFTPDSLALGKYSSLAELERIYPSFDGDEADVERFLSQTGRQTPPAGLDAKLDRLSEHWDCVAAAFSAPSTPAHVRVNPFWQAVPAMLEAGAAAVDDLVARSLEQRAAIDVLEATAVSQASTIDALEANAANQASTIDALATVAKRQVAAIDALRANSTRQASTIDALEGSSVRQQTAIEHLDVERTRLVAQLDESRLLAKSVNDALIDRQQAIAELHGSRSWRITAPLRAASDLMRRDPVTDRIVVLRSLRRARLEREPFEWARVDGLFTGRDGHALAETFPLDDFELIVGHGGEKDYEYEARPLVPMGRHTISGADDLSESWLRLAHDIISPAYREAMSDLTRRDLTNAALEVNLFHYGSGASLGAHADLPDKIATHVIYFNRAWEPAHGGCLSILRSSDPDAVFTRIVPELGSSVVLVRSDNSWHAVSPVVSDSMTSRRSLTATFYHPGSTSSMWPDD